MKININASERKPVYFHEREIWWCQLGINIGHEENGKNILFERPVLVLTKISRRLALVIPLTSADSSLSFHIDVGVIGKKQAKVILTQARTIDAKRLSNKILTLEEGKFIQIKNAAKKFLFP